MKNTKKEQIANTLNPNFQYLPIDTKYFKDLEIEILGLFDDLDEALDGRLIKSDNFQALNTLLPKYKEQIQTIYIDPPFNLDESASYDYLVNYKDSTWATILENRLAIAKEYLNNDGNIFIRCDYNGNWIVRPIMNSEFGNENFRNELVINKSNKQGAISKRFNPATESLFLYSKMPYSQINPQFKRREKQGHWIEMHSPKQNKESHVVVFSGKQYIAPKGRHWSFAQETVDRFIIENRIREVEKNYIDVYGNEQKKILEYLMSEDETIESNWTDIPSYSTTTGFQTENSEKLLSRVIATGSKGREIVLDFFLGSGTATASAHKLDRRWIGIEIGEQFYNYVVPRMKKVISMCKDIKTIGGGFFKYYELEQYEDTLNRGVYNPTEKELENIDFSLSEKQAKVAMDIDIAKEKVRFVFEKLYPDVDIPETISNLFGKKIKKITKNKVIFEDDFEMDLNNLDFDKYESLKKLIYW